MKRKNHQEDVLTVLVSEEEIKAKVKELGQKIHNDYKDKNLLLISILKGSVVFMADLMRTIDLRCTIDFMSVSSYANGTQSSGVVKILKDLDHSIEGKDVLIVEDIIDSGNTLHYLKNILSARHPNSIKIATLLDKPARREADIEVEYACFNIPDEFVVGYGLDFAEEYRDLPYIGILKPDVYESIL